MTVRVYEYHCNVLTAIFDEVIDYVDYDDYKAKLEADNNEDFYVHVEVL